MIDPITIATVVIDRIDISSIITNLKFILNSTVTHATGLASFAAFYKLLKRILMKLRLSKSLQSLLSAGIVGYFVFGRDTRVNEQV